MVLSENQLVDHMKMGLVQTLPLDLNEQIAPFGVLRRRGEGTVGVSGGAGEGNGKENS